MSEIEDSLFIQFKHREHRDALLDGELRVTQQQYYRYLRSEVSDSLEGEQLLQANGERFTLFGNHSTYIWSSSAINKKELSEIKKFVDYDFGLLILEPNTFIEQVYESLTKTPILKNNAEISFEPVVYSDKEQPMAEDKGKPLCRWTKPQGFSDEREFRLCVHNVPPMKFIKDYFPEELYRVEELHTPHEEVENKQTYYRLIFEITFDFDYELYSFNGLVWFKDS